MKAENLKILRDHGLRVPAFITVQSGEIPDLSFSRAPLFAVRSSFAGEDSEKRSFAGQFKTLLNVKREDVPGAIAEVLASYGDAKPYLRAGGVQGTGGDTVIVQEMVDAELSGVIFTANPLGILNETVITAGYGLGSGVVEDRVKTVTYFCNRDENRFYRKEESELSLEPSLLNALIALADQIKGIFDRECDIEFAVRAGEVYILQARPITTLDQKKILILDNSNIVESYPGVSLPMTQDFVCAIYRDIFTSCVKRIAKSQALTEKLRPVLDSMVVCSGGGMYYQISSWYELLHLLPFSKKLIGIWQDMLGVDNRFVSEPSLRVTSFTKFRIALVYVYYLLRAPSLMKKLNRYFEEIYPVFWEKVENTDEIEPLLKQFWEIEARVTEVWDITLINDMVAFINTALSGGSKNAQIADIKNMASMKPVEAVNELICTAKRCGTTSDAYRSAEAEYIWWYGDRGPEELKLETKTFRTNPELLRSYVESQMGDMRREERQKDREKPKKRILNPFVCGARRGILNREQSRLNRSRLFGLARSICLKIGEILCKNGQIERSEDIFYLYFEEINEKTDFRPLIRTRRAEYDAYKSRHLPRRLVFAGEAVDCVRQPCTDRFESVGLLRGSAASLGRVRGEVIVMKQADQSAPVDGKIMVTRTTDPGWVFLIERCIGIIAEQGSVLSHTAIISRELGKPSVVNVKDATEILQTGDLVEMDAASGQIVILERRKSRAK